MSFKQTLQRVKADRAADREAPGGSPGVSNALMNTLMGSGLSALQLQALDGAYDQLVAAEDLESAMDAARRVEEMGILNLAKDAFTVYGEDVYDAMGEAELATTGAGAASLFAAPSVESDDEKALLTELAEQGQRVEDAKSTLHAVAQQHFKLPAGRARIPDGEPSRAAIERVGDELELEVDHAVEAVNGFNRATTPVEAFSAVKEHIGPEPGRNAYVIGACITASVHDDETTAAYAGPLCQSFDVSMGRFADLFLADKPSIGDADDGGRGDAAHATQMLPGVLAAIAKGGSLDADKGRAFATELNPDGALPQYAENARPVLEAYRLHAYLRDACLTAAHATDDGALEPNELAFAQEMLEEARHLMPQVVEGVRGLLGRSKALADGAAETGLRQAIADVNQTHYDSFEAAILPDLELRLDVLAAAEGRATADVGAAGLPTPDDLQAMADAVVAAGEEVEKSVMGFNLKLAKNPLLSQVKSLSKLPLKAMSLQEIHAAARERQLTDDEEWDRISTWSDVGATCMGAVQTFTDYTADSLEGVSRSNIFNDQADWDQMDRLRAHTADLRRVSGLLGKVSKVSDVVGVLGNVKTLVDADASLDDKVDAGLDLLDTAAGFTPVGGIVSLGLAYVQLIRSEFKRIEAISRQSYAGLAAGAFDQVSDAMSRAERASTRLVAAESLLDPNAPLTDERNAKVRALLETLAELALLKTKSVDGFCMDVTDTDGHVSEAMVGWTGSQVDLRQQYVADAGSGPAALEGASSLSSYDAQIEALRQGGGQVFAAAGNLASNIGFHYKTRMLA